MELSKSDVILVLAPHTDDGELGAGASISKWTDGGAEVHYVAFSACETIQPPDREPDILRHECRRATSKLGVAEDHQEVLSFEVRNFYRDRQLVLDAMVELNAKIQPQVVLLPSTDDTHQDHFVVSNESRRAFKHACLLGYEVPWNNFRFETSAFVMLTREHVERKVEALSQFRSQQDRPYMSDEYQRAHLRFRGVQAGGEYAEAFQVLRWYL